MLKIHLPVIVDDTLRAVGSTIGPVSMIVTGMLIAGMNLRDIFTNRRVYAVTFLRLLLVPVLGTDYSENQWSGYMASTR